MDISCPKCGAANRNTSRFCARCGEVLKAAEGVAQNGKGLTLSWLEGVQERAVKQTGELSAQKLAEAEARLSSRTVEAEPEPKTEPLIEPEAGATAQAGVAGEGAVKTGEVPQVPAVPG